MKVVEGGDETVVVLLVGNDDVTASSRTIDSKYVGQISLRSSAEITRKNGDGERHSPTRTAVSRLTVMPLNNGSGLGRGDETGSQSGEDDYVEGSHSVDGCGTR